MILFWWDVVFQLADLLLGQNDVINIQYVIIRYSIYRCWSPV